jgi:hypothetical protein
MVKWGTQVLTTPNASGSAHPTSAAGHS